MSYSFKESSILLDWLPPPLGFVKLNFDGSSYGNPGPSMYGSVIRDHLGKVICVVAGPIAHGDSMKAEVMGLIAGWRELKKLRSINCLVEDDSSVVVGWSSGYSIGSWKFANIIHEIRNIMSFLKASLAHIPRSQNSIADKIAKWAVGIEEVYISDVVVVAG